MSFSKWLALLAIGVQLVLPLSIGLQITARGTASALTVFDTELCLADHSGTSPGFADANRAVAPDSTGPGPIHNDNPAAGCPLCLALQVMHAFTDTLTAALPAPTIPGGNLTLSSHDAAVTTAHTASYKSRAPPVMA